jgi:hypothetical protein
MIETILAIMAAFWFGCAAGSYATTRRLVVRGRREAAQFNAMWDKWGR